MRMLLVVLLMLTASPSWSTVIAAASCSQADVSTAIGTASAGDTVTVPATGSPCTWTSGITVVIGINIIGTGSVTIINNYSNAGNGTYLIKYLPSDFAANAPFRVSGFTFNFTNSAAGHIIKLAHDESSSFVIQTKIRIDHNVFTGDTSNHQAIVANGMRGVIDSNTFTNFPQPIRFASNYGTSDWWNNWEGIVYAGTDNNMYIEDNIFTGVTVNLVDCQYSNRYVFRYNTISATAGLYPIWDMHGNQDAAHGNMWSGFGGEIYGNQITSSYDGKLLDHRGGKMLVFANNFTNTTGNQWYIEVHDIYPDSDNPSTNIQPQYPTDTYYWLNRKNLTGAFNTVTLGEQVNGHPTENADYFIGTNSFDGTVGVGYGILASRPVTCATGVGYWATTQSCMDLTGMVGVAPSAPISGTLYKCTATNTWTAYYAPYTYPHPLRGEGALSGSRIRVRRP